MLAKAGLQSRVIVPIGFVYDFESIPRVRGTNKRGGTAHDPLCRKNFIHGVTKAIAAAVYFEIMEYCYSIDANRKTWVEIKDWARRWTKWGVVRIWPGYFHKFDLMATCKEIAGIDGDPYITIEKLEATQTEGDKL